LTSTSTPPSITREELVRRAAALAPRLRERAPLAEELRRIPDATVDDLLSAELVRIGNPDRYGGLGVDYNVMFDVAAELGRACPSTAWCYAIWTSHNWLVGQWPLEAQEEYFASGPDTLSSSSFGPDGATTRIAEGGFRLSGRWEFSSGCDAASWAMLGVPGPAGAMRVLVPRADFQIVDTWHVSGLRGTGSKDIVVPDAFVPVHRTLATGSIGEDVSNGWRLHRRPSYRVPHTSLFPLTLAAPLPGIVQGALDEFVGRVRRGGRSADSSAVQLRISEASAEVDTARLLLQHDAQEMIDRAAAGEPFNDLRRARYVRDRAFLTKLCLQAVNRLFEASGGHSLFDTDPMQRFHRDAHALSHRSGLILDLSGEAYGRTHLGLDP
jgi:3-hydroxy-9,10-secoandrosta-1,3,5(10)-triene-9,17-dione monooxygenase